MDEDTTSTVESGDRSSGSPYTPVRGPPVQARMSQRRLTKKVHRKKHRRLPWRDSYVVQVLKQQLSSGPAPLSKGALAILHSVVKDLFDRIALEANKLKECLDGNPEDPVGPNEIQAALQILLPPQPRIQPLPNRFGPPLLLLAQEHPRWR